MIFVFLPLLAVLAGVAAGLIFRARPVAAGVAAAAIPIILLYAFAIHRAGPEMIPGPGLWILAGTWAVLVGAGWLVARYGFRRP